jgi:predicted SnoaL-like aldol condensation-catalyzing enzyme
MRWAALALMLMPLASCGAEPVVAPQNQTGTTRAIATAFLQRYFIDRDFGAYAAFARPDFIQHNPNVADGVAGHRAFFAKRKRSLDRQAHVIDMVLVDGDLFAVMHHGVGPDGKAKLFVDLWRVEGGKIAEHWDVVQDIPPVMPHDNGMACGIESWAEASARRDSVEAPACGKPDPHARRAASIQIYRDYTSQVAKGDVLGAITRWFHPAYKQHSPIIADGKQGAINYLKAEWGKPGAPVPKLGPMRIVAEGDLVLCHYLYSVPGTAITEVHIDIFRITDGLVSEHWDVKQAVPGKAANRNGMW